ncbi:MAG: undecaprenyl-diphosphate phosphatase [Bacteroidota bacterium]|nr:undecaprenyl-diphosphate phosphatase [Bacteroidota bacterium]
MNFFQAVLLAIIEGITEFLPVSSTGHMVLATSGMGITADDFVKTFTVAIQLGAILAVIALYWKKFINFKDYKFYLKLLVAVIPALILGILLNDFIDEKLGNPLFIACSLFGGGILFLFIDNIFKTHSIREEKNISVPKAFIIGCWQSLAILLPGLSRSGATIIGGMQQKLTRNLAAEFSFFLAVPTMFAATGYKLYKFYDVHGGFTGEQIKLLGIGNLVAFIVAIFAIKGFIGIVKKYGFRIWGYYRIVLGLTVILIHYFVHPITVF